MYRLPCARGAQDAQNVCGPPPLLHPSLIAHVQQQALASSVRPAITECARASLVHMVGSAHGAQCTVNDGEAAPGA